MDHAVTEETPGNFQPGVRFTGRDAVFLVAAGFFAWWVGDRGPGLATATAFVAGNFFLFCNVFRIARPLELMWTAVFLVLAAVRLRTGAIEWWTVYMACGILTATVVLIEMRQPSYHGLGWATINPGLKKWWLKRKSGGVVPRSRSLSMGDSDASSTSGVGTGGGGGAVGSC